MTILVSLADGVSMGLLLPLVQGLTTGDASSALRSFGVLGTLIMGMTPAFGDPLSATVVFVAVVVLGKCAVMLLSQFVIDSIQWRFVHELRLKLYSQLLEVSYSFASEQKTGQLMYAFETQCLRAGYVLSSLGALYGGGVRILIYVGLLLWVSVPMTVIACAFAAIISVIVQGAIARSRAAAYESNRTDTVMNVVLHEGLSAMRLVRTYGRESFELRRLAQAADLTRRAYLRKFRYKSLPGPSSEGIAMVGLATALLVGVRTLGTDLAVAGPSLVTFLVVLFRLLPVVSGLNSQRAVLAADMPQLEAVLDLIRRDDKSYVRSGSVRFDQLQRNISFDRVSFTYKTRSEPALKDVSFEILKGRVTAFVGSSGAGKSTVADVLVRLYDPQQGRILVDGTDLRELNLADWRSAIGVVSQDSFIFNASVLDNIRYGRPEASETDIIEAARLAHAHEFIQCLPNGYHTLVGERGTMLSGGQRQRISIARAVLRNPQLLILDEATSALDNVSERLVQQAIDEISAERTVVVIAHRLSTIEKADHIIVLDGGRVAEAGRHHELLHRGGPYSRLYRHAASGNGRVGDQATEPAGTWPL